MKTARNLEPLQRVSYRYPCPVCGKPDWCGFNTQIAICMRVQSNYPIKNGGWLHKLDKTPVYVLQDVIKSQVPIAPVEVRNKVYKELMDCLTLSPDHLHELSAKRGLSEDIIKENFRSTPKTERPWTICKRLLDRGYDLEGVPGFYRAQNRKGGYYWTFSMRPGFVLPIRDAEGRIQALQTRLDKPDSRGKYRLFGSSKKEAGSCCGTPIHVAKPSRLTGNRIWITEGPLKATIASQYLGETVQGLVGATTWRPVMDMLKGHKGAEVILAYDMDQLNNVWVKRAVQELTKSLVSNGYSVNQASWNRYNGIDDAVMNGERIFIKTIN